MHGWGEASRVITATQEAAAMVACEARMLAQAEARPPVDQVPAIAPTTARDGPVAAVNQAPPRSTVRVWRSHVEYP